MDIKVRALTETTEMLNRARRTVKKEALDKEPSDKFIRSIYLSEHSPIRDRIFTVSIKGIKSWVATHLARHSVGYTPYISTQRDDRVDYDGSRDDRKQGDLVDMDITLNAQAFINVSRKRLCHMAHPETVKVWRSVIDELAKLDPHLADVCVPECIYRGFCPEIHTCGLWETEHYKKLRADYMCDCG